MYEVYYCAWGFFIFMLIMSLPSNFEQDSINQDSGVNRSSGSILSAPNQSQGNNEMNEAWLTQKRLNLMEVVRSVPVFTGDDSAVPFTLFWDKFNQFASFFHWSKENQFFAIQQRLAGSAQLIFLNFKSEVKSADDVSKLLRERFSQAKHPADILAEF